MVSGNFWKTFKSCPYAWYPAKAKQIYIPGKRSYIPGPICKLFHFALSLLNSEIAITPERVARLTWFFGSMPKIKIYDHLIFQKNWFWPTFTALATPLSWAVHCVTLSPIDVANKIVNAIWAPEDPLNAWKVIPIHFQGAQGHFGSHLTHLKWPIAV